MIMDAVLTLLLAGAVVLPDAPEDILVDPWLVPKCSDWMFIV